MPNIHGKIGEKSQPTGGGMRRVLSDGSESMAELREFMGQMQGKSPNEVLGAVANSSLLRSTLLAAVGFAVILFGLSIVVHYTKPEKKKKAAAAAPSTPKPSRKAEDQTAPPKADEQQPQKAADATGTKEDKTLKNLGHDESKQTDPKKNPLENSLDNLLDGTK